MYKPLLRALRAFVASGVLLATKTQIALQICFYFTPDLLVEARSRISHYTLLTPGSLLLTLVQTPHLFFNEFQSLMVYQLFRFYNIDTPRIRRSINLHHNVALCFG